MKERKQIYYAKYFESNWNSIRNTWKGIKTIISIKFITTTIPHSTEFNNRTMTDPTTISNVFNNYFTSIVDKLYLYTKKQSKVHYANYRPISLLSNIEKIFEKHMYKRLSHFLDTSNLIYSL